MLEDSTEPSGTWNGPTTDEPSVLCRRADDERPVSRTVVETVAEASGVAPMEIDQPLYEAVDPDALDRLFEPADEAVVGGQVIFSYAGYEVTVTARGDVCVCPQD